MSNISELLGKTIVKIKGADKDSWQIDFVCSDSTKYRMYHDQDCCEVVRVEDIVGDIKDLINSPILKAEDNGSHREIWDGYMGESGTCTYTYYKLATINGYVDIRWYGSSNGYYSEAVTFKQVKNGDEDE